MLDVFQIRSRNSVDVPAIFPRQIMACSLCVCSMAVAVNSWLMHCIKMGTIPEDSIWIVRFCSCGVPAVLLIVVVVVPLKSFASIFDDDEVIKSARTSCDS